MAPKFEVVIESHLGQGGGHEVPVVGSSLATTPGVWPIKDKTRKLETQTGVWAVGFQDPSPVQTAHCCSGPRLPRVPQVPAVGRPVGTPTPGSQRLSLCETCVFVYTRTRLARLVFLLFFCF